MAKFSHIVGSCTECFDGADALSAAPDVFPSFGDGITARAKVHFARIAFGKVVWIKSGRLNGRLEIVTVNTGK